VKHLLGRIPRPFGRRWLIWQSRRPYLRTWDDRPLLVLPGVLDPVATKVGAWLASVCATATRPGETWLDMGAGTGIVGVALARAGAVVTSVDIDPTAVRNTQANAALHGVSVEALSSDLFTALPGRRFDRVVYNIPFWPGDPAGRPFGRAMYAGREFEAIHAFVAAFPVHAPEAWVVLSEYGGDFPKARAALGPARLIRRERVRGEWLSLFALPGR
jgi:SAM-dependent methyltransferase